MTRADDFRCKNCGYEWYWTEIDYAENDRIKKAGMFSNVAGVLVSTGSWKAGDAVNGYVMQQNGRQALNRVVDFSLCPNCNSRDIMQTGSHMIGADNPFLQNGGNSSSTFQGAPGTTQGMKKPLTAGLLAIFLGGFGAHKFYLGYSKEGAIMLAVWLIGLLAMAIPSLIVSVIGIIEGFIYISKDSATFQSTYVTGHKSWF